MNVHLWPPNWDAMIGSVIGYTLGWTFCRISNQRKDQP